jgi:hypothetical protein
MEVKSHKIIVLVLFDDANFCQSAPILIIKIGFLKASLRRVFKNAVIAVRISLVKGERSKLAELAIALTLARKQ